MPKSILPLLLMEGGMLRVSNFICFAGIVNQHSFGVNPNNIFFITSVLMSACSSKAPIY